MTQTKLLFGNENVYINFTKEKVIFLDTEKTMSLNEYKTWGMIKYGMEKTRK